MTNSSCITLMQAFGPFQRNKAEQYAFRRKKTMVHSSPPVSAGFCYKVHAGYSENNPAETVL